ncbi:MAG: hypothetical protein HYR76_09270 [Ignavibacteria bacterium]|nr:hypothetical protein [Ignavibacteria bacterium]MBI3765674.1 hypothetical protein [Ignavibacteriales bacterium]
MYLVRDIMYCKPGQVRPMVDKFKQLSKVMKKMGFTTLRIMTDVSAERYWTVVSEQEVESLENYAEMSRKTMTNKDLQKIMKDYHELVESGRREIYKIEK